MNSKSLIGFLVCGIFLAASLVGAEAVPGDAGLEAVRARVAADAAAVPPSRSSAGIPRVPTVNRTLPADTAPVATTPAEKLTAMRIFEEPLLPFGHADDAETVSLLELARAFQAAPDRTSAAALEAWLSAHPASAWSTSREVGLGLWLKRNAYFSSALPLWSSAWQRSRAAQPVPERALADRAVGELLQLYGWIGHAEKLDALLAEVGKRPLLGPAKERVVEARQGREVMLERPDIGFQCGPLAIARILQRLKRSAAEIDQARAFPSTERGTSLLQLRDLSRQVGLPGRVARRAPGAQLLVPAVLHRKWKQ